MPRSQAETGAPPSWSTRLGAMPPPSHPLLKTGLRSSHCTRTRPRSPWWAVTALAVCRTLGYEHGCQGRAHQGPHPRPCSHHRDWEGRGWVSPPAPAMPWPGRLLSPWSPLVAWSFVLVSPVFTGPLDAKMAAGDGCGCWEGCRGVAQSTLEGVSGHVPRDLLGFTWPLTCPHSVLSCGSRWAPYLSPSLGLQPPDQCSCPQSRPQPLLRQIWVFLSRGRVRG